MLIVYKFLCLWGSREMDPALRALCVEVVEGNVDSEGFAWLLIETGVDVDDFEWKVAARLIGKKGITNSLAQNFVDTVH